MSSLRTFKYACVDLQVVGSIAHDRVDFDEAIGSMFERAGGDRGVWMDLHFNESIGQTMIPPAAKQMVSIPRACAPLVQQKENSLIASAEALPAAASMPATAVSSTSDTYHAALAAMGLAAVGRGGAAGARAASTKAAAGGGQSKSNHQHPQHLLADGRPCFVRPSRARVSCFRRGQRQQRQKAPPSQLLKAQASSQAASGRQRSVHPSRLLEPSSQHGHALRSL